MLGDRIISDSHYSDGIFGRFLLHLTFLYLKTVILKNIPGVSSRHLVLESANLNWNLHSKILDGVRFGRDKLLLNYIKIKDHHYISWLDDLLSYFCLCYVSLQLKVFVYYVRRVVEIKSPTRLMLSGSEGRGGRAGAPLAHRLTWRSN